MSKTFDNKVAIVTGGASGLGAALSGELVSRGARIVIADINADAARAVAHQLGAKAEALGVDVSDSTEVTKLVNDVAARYGSLDYMFNNAGLGNYGEILDVRLSEWRRILDVNLWGVIYGSIAAYRVMAMQRFGHIVNIGSMATFIHDPLFCPYVTSKSAVVAFTRVLAIEAEDYGIRTTLVCPGNIKTPMLARQEPSRFHPPISADEAARRILKGTAQNRRFVVFPFYAHIMWWCDRINPDLLNPLRRVIVRRARARATSRASD